MRKLLVSENKVLKYGISELKKAAIFDFLVFGLPRINLLCKALSVSTGRVNRSKPARLRLGGSKRGVANQLFTCEAVIRYLLVGSPSSDNPELVLSLGLKSLLLHSG